MVRARRRTGGRYWTTTVPADPGTYGSVYWYRGPGCGEGHGNGGRVRVGELLPQEFGLAHGRDGVLVVIEIQNPGDRPARGDGVHRRAAAVLRADEGVRAAGAETNVEAGRGDRDREVHRQAGSRQRGPDDRVSPLSGRVDHGGAQTLRVGHRVDRGQTDRPLPHGPGDCLPRNPVAVLILDPDAQRLPGRMIGGKGLRVADDGDALLLGPAGHAR